MAEPISNSGIEDVLSSIRRLVSQDLRPASRPDPSVPPTAEAEAGHLLLTPALRIVPADPKPMSQLSGDALVLAPEMVANPAEPPHGKDEVISRLGAAVVEDDWEAPEGDTGLWVPGGGLDATAFAQPPRPAQPGAAVGFDFANQPYTEFHGFGGAVPDPDLMDALASAKPSQADAVPPRRVSPPVDERSWADDAEAAVKADLAAHPIEDEAFDALEPGMTFDEEVLRDLVRDLIREELAGTLGERITRNVRKLVRAEIARAAALREFE